MRWDVTLKDVEAVFPNNLSSLGVERHHPFLERCALLGRVLHVQSVAHDDGSRSAAEGRTPEEVLAVERPFVRKTGFGGDAIPVRTSRFWPVAKVDPPRALG